MCKVIETLFEVNVRGPLPVSSKISTGIGRIQGSYVLPYDSFHPYTHGPWFSSSSNVAMMLQDVNLSPTVFSLLSTVIGHVFLSHYHSDQSIAQYGGLITQSHDVATQRNSSFDLENSYRASCVQSRVVKCVFDAPVDSEQAFRKP